MARCSTPARTKSTGARPHGRDRTPARRDRGRARRWRGRPVMPGQRTPQDPCDRKERRRDNAMLLYNVRIALKSLKRSPILTALIIGGIMLGITVSTMFSTIKHSFAKDPVPTKSGVLYYVRMDSWDPARPYVPDDPTIPPNQIPYRDMAELLKSKIPVRHVGMFKAQQWISTGAKDARPERVLVRMCTSDFFKMFDVPFLYGSGWDKKDGEEAESVLVLSAEQNDKLFGGENSVGRTVRVGERDLKVVGVTDHWKPSIKFYDLTQQWIQPP